MEDSKKKPIMIGVIAVCLVLAITITIMRSTKSSTGVESLQRGEMIWVKCSNPACGTEYQMDQKDYYDYVEQHQDLKNMTTTQPSCQKCGEPSIYPALKCTKCGSVYFKGSIANAPADKCPSCSYSETEEIKKQRGK